MEILNYNKVVFVLASMPILHVLLSFFVCKTDSLKIKGWWLGIILMTLNAVLLPFLALFGESFLKTSGVYFLILILLTFVTHFPIKRLGVHEDEGSLREIPRIYPILFFSIWSGIIIYKLIVYIIVGQIFADFFKSL